MSRTVVLNNWDRLLRVFAEKPWLKKNCAVALQSVIVKRGRSRSLVDPPLLNMSLTEQYLNLINQKLPAAAQQGGYPVRFNHCFTRIILDNVFGKPWYEAIAKPAYKNMTEAQMKEAIAIGQAFLDNPRACHDANRRSLEYRGKLG